MDVAQSVSLRVDLVGQIYLEHGLDLRESYALGAGGPFDLFHARSSYFFAMGARSELDLHHQTRAAGVYFFYRSKQGIVRNWKVVPR
jgi:hypothetical protein